MAWSISPNDASIDSNGNATIPPNTTSSPKIYTITYSDSQCTCIKRITVEGAEPVQTCTYSVSSDIEGAVVEWSNGRSGVIIDGVNSIEETGGGSYTVHLSKDGCEFPDNDKTVPCGGGVVINGTCTQTCAFTVYSNEEGATVTWSNGSTGIISGGKATVSLQNTSSIGVNIRKTNCSFPISSTTISCNSSATLNGTCTTPCTCVVNGTETYVSNVTSTTVYTVATYSSNGCSGNWTSPILVDGTDFLGNFSYDNGNLKAQVSTPNTGSDSRSATYRIGIGTCSKTFIVYQNGTEPCTCTATPTSTPLSSGVTSDVVVGSYSRSGSCPGEYNATKTSGADFLSITAFTGSNIRGNIISTNTTSSARTATYIIKRGDTVCNNNFVVTQAAGSPTPTPCTCAATPVTTKLPSIITSNVTVGSYSRSGDCSGAYRANFVTGSGTDFLGNFNFSNNNITANVTSANPTTSTRSGTYRIYKGDTLCSSNFTVTQAAGSPTPTVCSCSSSNFSVTGVNVDASGGNAVLIANFTSECEPSLSFGNYAGETFINYSSTSSTYDSSTKKGKIYAKVPQNTTSSDRTEQVGVYINNETDFCKHFTVTQSGATSTCTCNSINITQQSVSFDHNSGSTKVGTIEQGCTLNVLSTSDWASLTQNGTDIVASVKENTTSSGRGTGLAYNIVGFTANTCGTVVFTQSGAPTTYNISIYGEQAETASGVKVYLAYTASPTLPSDAHFQFENGCTLRINYWNCNGNTEHPIVPNNHVVPNCTPGSGQEYAIESGTRVQMETLSVNFSLFGETHHLTSGGSGTYTNQGNTYIVTVQ